MDQLIVTALVSIVGSVSGIVGVMIGGRISAAAAERSARSAERQHFRGLGMQFATTNFEICMKVGEMHRDNGKTVVIPPLKTFVIQGIKFMEIVSDSSLSSDEMIKRIAEIDDFARAITLAYMTEKQAEQAMAPQPV